MASNNDTDYDYEAAGFNKFLTKPVGLAARGHVRAPQGIAFDQRQFSGALGDIIQVGSITIDGSEGNIKLSDGETVRMLIGFQEDGF